MLRAHRFSAHFYGHAAIIALPVAILVHLPHHLFQFILRNLAIFNSLPHHFHAFHRADVFVHHHGMHHIICHRVVLVSHHLTISAHHHRRHIARHHPAGHHTIRIAVVRVRNGCRTNHPHSAERESYAYHNSNHFIADFAFSFCHEITLTCRLQFLCNSFYRRSGIP